jgi:hypothetical protein
MAHSLQMASANRAEVAAVVKHTFWELVCDTKSGRARSYSDPQLLNVWTDSCSSDIDDVSTFCDSSERGSSDVATLCWSDEELVEAKQAPGVWNKQTTLLQVPKFRLEQRCEAFALRESETISSTHGAQQLTTIMLKNLPNNLNRDGLLELVNAAGFQTKCDFLYLPIDSKSDANLGYAFLNLVDAHTAQAFWSAFDGFQSWGGDRCSNKVCRLEWSQLQGYDAHVQRYRNSPLLRDGSSDKRRPILLNRGQRISFPKPSGRAKVMRSVPRSKAAKAC